MPGTRAFFIACLGIALLLLIAVPALGGLFAPRLVPDEVVQGYRVWQTNGCDGCHALAGQGGIYASDLTHIYGLRGETYLRQFLLDPAASAPNADRIMPRYAFPVEEISPLLVFLKWADENNVLFPPNPVGESGLIRSRTNHADGSS